MGQIIQRSPRAQHAFLCNYFLQFDITRCHLAEVGVQGQRDDSTEVMQTRYMDNAYVTSGSVLVHIHTELALFLEILHHTIYGIKMKWETTGVAAHWCDCRLLTAPSLDRCIKGVPIGEGTGPAISLWRRWPDPLSPNCPSVLKSMIPGLVHKTVQIHGSTRALQANVQCIVQGCGYKNYKWAWWWLHIRVRFQHLNLRHVIPLTRVKDWYQQGRDWAGQGGTP